MIILSSKFQSTYLRSFFINGKYSRIKIIGFTNMNPNSTLKIYIKLEFIKKDIIIYDTNK